MTPRTRRRLLELLLWGGISLATAVILVMVSDKVLPTNF